MATSRKGPPPRLIAPLLESEFHALVDELVALVGPCDESTTRAIAATCATHLHRFRRVHNAAPQHSVNTTIA